MAIQLLDCHYFFAFDFSINQKESNNNFCDII